MASTGSSRRKVPFGGHQLAEYTLAAAFVAVEHPPEWAPGGRAAGAVGAVKAAEWARGLGREASDDDIDFLVNLTNNGWFGEGSAQWQHAAAAVFRAVENGLTLMRY